MRYLRGLAGAAVFAGLVSGTGAAGPASALTPPPPASSIAYSFGDQIVRIAADGSDRRELTTTGPFPAGDLQGRTGDASPQLSPDGSHLIFTRSTPEKVYGIRHRIMLANADGSGARPVFRDSRKTAFRSPAWMPDGNSVVLARSIDRGRSTARSVVIAGLDGKSVKTVFKLPAKEDRSGYLEPIDIGVSPNGSKLLITVSNGYFYDRKYLVMVDLKTGKQRTIGKNTRSGSFSPDGERFVYVSSAGNRGETCTETSESSCVIQGDLYTQDIDGGGKQRVTRSRAAEENPDWSPDGQRIAFDANYNMPESGAAAEIYAIAPDGTCLSWLTNGTPYGVEPDWAPDTGRSDLTCGIEPREPFISSEWGVADPETAAISVWAGPVMGVRLVSEATLSGPFRYSTYEDCAVFKASDCKPEPKFEIGGLSNCFAGLYLGTIVGEARRSAFGERKGVTFLRSVERLRRGKVREVTVFTGDTLLSISGNRRTTFAELEAQIDNLRPASATEPPARLPALHLPEGMPRTVKAVDRLVRRIGIKRAGRRLDVPAKELRLLVRFAKRMPMLGPIRTRTCTKEEEDPFAGF